MGDFSSEINEMFNPLSSLNKIMMPKELPPIIELPVSQTNPAQWTYERLVEYINEFEKKLDSEHEIGARLVNFGQTVTFHIEDMGYYGPDIITFDGVNSDDERVQLIQNISQLSILLIAMKKRQEKAKRIGFQLQKEAHENE